MRPVSAWTRRSSASWARVVMPGLSVSTSLPWRMAASAIAARSAGMAEVSTTAIGVVLEDRGRVGDALRLREGLGEGGGERLVGLVEGGELGAGAQQAVDLAVDVVVGEADGRDLHGVGPFESGQRFMPVVAMPSISRRWKNRKKKKIGTSDSVDIAKRPPQSRLAGGVDEGAQAELHGVVAACR